MTNPALGVVVGINHKSSSLMMATDFKHAGLVKTKKSLQTSLEFLREINSGDFGPSKTVIFGNFRGPEF